MKKVILILAVLAGATAHAEIDSAANEQSGVDATDRALDHAQPVPDASITTKIVSETTSTLIDESGPQAINITKSVTVDNSKTAKVATVERSELILPEPQMVDRQLDFSQTLQKMRSSFQALVEADDIEALKSPADTMAKYTDQAYLLASQESEMVNLANSEQVIADLQALRGLLVELRRAIVNNDFILAKTKVDVINQAQEGIYTQFNVH